MTPSNSKATLVTLTRGQIASILHDMGWEDEDVSAFYRLARCEMRDPGCLARQRQAYWDRICAQEEDR